MIRAIFLILAISLSGCTIAWTKLRPVQPAQPGWTCPAKVNVSVASSYTTNSFGPKEYEAKHNQNLKSHYHSLAEKIINTKHCSSHGNNETLMIKIEDMQQVSALPQEYLTGLSFGLIPSWGTRFAEVKLTFEQGGRSAIYMIDDKRINHLILFPVFWLSFFLTDDDEEFENALNDFTASL